MNYMLDKHLKAGRIVQFGEIGNFRLAVGSTGSVEADKFSTSLIKKPKIVFTPGSKLQETRQLTSFEKEAAEKETGNENAGGSDRPEIE